MELAARGLADTAATEVLATRNFDLVRFPFTGDGAALARLGTVDDVYRQLEDVPLTGAFADLKALRDRVAGSARLIPALAAHRAFRAAGRGRVASTPRDPRYRVLCQAEDQPWRKYRRVDMEEAVTKALRARQPGWRPVEDDADLEVWVHQAGRRALVSLRLSDIGMRQRDYKDAHRPASLRPSVARAMALLSAPADGDIVLDPMCGAGTLLIERALAGRYRKLLGGDLDPAAVDAARENFGARHKPWELAVWDATALPLDDASVDCVLVNPPWGRKVGSAPGNEVLYPALLAEAARVLKPGGRMIALTSEWDLFKGTVRATRDLTVGRALQNVSVLGRRADIFVLRRRAGGS